VGRVEECYRPAAPLGDTPGSPSDAVRPHREQCLPAIARRATVGPPRRNTTRRSRKQEARSEKATARIPQKPPNSPGDMAGRPSDKIPLRLPPVRFSTFYQFRMRDSQDIGQCVRESR
jgi:hypothetical protein